MQPDPPASVERLHDVGGYRVVRILAAGRHGTTMLVHGDGRSFVARVLHRDCPAELIDREVAVSDAAASGPESLRSHVSVVQELCTTDDGRIALLTEYLAGPRLDALLRSRDGTLDVGEAVTLLVPLAAALHDAHSIGVTGLLRDAAEVRLRSTGAPVMTSRHRARVGPALPERFREREPGYPADDAAFDRLGRAVAAALPAADQPALIAALGRRSARDLALFDLAEPLPVRFFGMAPEPQCARALERSPAEPGSPGRAELLAGGSLAASVTGGTSGTDASGSSPPPRVLAAVLGSLESLGLPAAVVTPVRGIAEKVHRHRDRIVELVRGRLPAATPRVRPRFAVVGVAGALALVVALGALGLAGGRETTPLSGAQQGRSAPSAQSSTDDRPGTTPIGAPETELHPDPEAWQVIVDELVSRWIDCAPPDTGDSDAGADAQPSAGDTGTTGGASCAATVVHRESAAASLITAADDRHSALRQWQREQGELVVIERMGAAVLVDLITSAKVTASLLVVRSEAGWRIRDVIG